MVWLYRHRGVVDVGQGGSAKRNPARENPAMGWVVIDSGATAVSLVVSEEERVDAIAHMGRNLQHPRRELPRGHPVGHFGSRYPS